MSLSLSQTDPLSIKSTKHLNSTFLLAREKRSTISPVKVSFICSPWITHSTAWSHLPAPWHSVPLCVEMEVPKLHWSPISFTFTTAYVLFHFSQTFRIVRIKRCQTLIIQFLHQQQQGFNDQRVLVASAEARVGLQRPSLISDTWFVSQPFVTSSRSIFQKLEGIRTFFWRLIIAREVPDSLTESTTAKISWHQKKL